MRRTISGVTKTISYEYNLAGQIEKVTYPSGRVVEYTYNEGGRLVEAKDVTNPSSPYSYAQTLTTAPHGAPARNLLGEVPGSFQGITYDFQYNNRLLPTFRFAYKDGAPPAERAILSFSYGYFANGLVSTQVNNLNPDATQNYTYDYLNRIKTAESQATSGVDCWGQSFGYHATYYTNLSSITVTKCTAPSLSLSISNKNRITNSDFAYDKAGKLTNDGVASYSWNAENRPTAAGGVTYTYDGDGWRVKKSNGTLYWHGSAERFWPSRTLRETFSASSSSTTASGLLAAMRTARSIISSPTGWGRSGRSRTRRGSTRTSGTSTRSAASSG